MSVEAEYVTKSHDDDIVDPWNVSSTSAAGIDYDKLIGKLDCHSLIILIS